MHVKCISKLLENEPGWMLNAPTHGVAIVAVFLRGLQWRLWRQSRGVGMRSKNKEDDRPMGQPTDAASGR